MADKLEQLKNVAKFISNLEENKKKFKQEMYNDTGHYQKIYGFELGKDPNHATWNNEADAFKHAYMQLIGTQRYTEPLAKLAGQWHEYDGNLNHGQPKGEENMDSWNNHVGRNLGKELTQWLKNDPGAKDETYVKNLAAQMVIDAMKSGKLITHPDDTRKYDPNPVFTDLKKKVTELLAPLNDGKTFFATEDIGKMSSDEFLSVEDIINEQIKNKFGITKNEANSGVASGIYIYVNEYVRNDGTKVRGYYRKR